MLGNDSKWQASEYSEYSRDADAIGTKRDLPRPIAWGKRFLDPLGGIPTDCDLNKQYWEVCSNSDE